MSTYASLSAVLRAVAPPGGFVVVAKDWPSSLISVLGLQLPLVAAYFPKHFHHYFNLPKNGVMQWTSTNDFHAPHQDSRIIYLLSGPSDFLHHVLSILEHRSQRAIVSVEFPRRGATRTALLRAARAGQAMLDEFHLHTLNVSDSTVGGATDGLYLMGFGNKLGSSTLPTVEPGLPRVLRHFLDGGVEGNFPVVYKSTLPPLEAPARTVLRFNGILRAEGLLPCRSPDSLLYAPSYRLRDRWVVRRLTMLEQLRLRQLPLSMDPQLSGLNVNGVFPFENSPSPEVFALFFRQLWGTSVGGCSEECDTGDETEDVIEMDASDAMLTAEEEELIAKEKELLGDLGGNSREVDSCKRDDKMTASITLSSGPEMSPPQARTNDWEFDLDCLAGRDVGSLLTDEDTITSVASEATLCCGGGRRNCGDEDSVWDKENELGPSPPQNPGPPFKVGDVILGDVPGHLWGMDPKVSWLQRCFILQANHPNYKIRMEKGATLWTNTTESYLIARWAMGEGTQFAEDADDPFADLRADPSLHYGSYGVHVDSQMDSLKKIAEAKEFAKAVKADDAEVPKYLWNDRVRCPPGVTKAQRDIALEAFRKLGHRWFLQGLVRDCLAYVRITHRTMWEKPRRFKVGELTKLGKDREAIASILWHSVNTSWFDYHAGSTLVHFRFPPRYREMARDGVEVFFEKPGPTTHDTQPSINDPRMREMAKEKIFKVVKRRYLLTLGNKAKSMIKYFAVPKGEDDIRMVYDATANHLNECVWVPSFWLPTIDSLLRTLDKYSWMTDRDVGDMFLNFRLHWKVRPFTGVDLSSLYDSPNDPGPRWAVWDRNLMGFAALPYCSVKMALVVEEVCRGDRHEEGVGADGKELNPFQWRYVRLNLPGTKDYDPCTSWISKIRGDGRVACDILSFVDDERVVGPDGDLTWQASHKLASTQSYLGMQDAGRKARLCSKQPGAWAGAIVHIVDALGVCVLTSVEKWLKLREILEKWSDRMIEQRGEEEIKLSHKELLSDRGFLVYVTRTYPAMVPYLKGFHLTIEMWRGGRDSEGWKLKEENVESVGSDWSVHSVSGRGDSLSMTQVEDEDMARINYRVGVKRGNVGVYAPEDGLTSPVPRFKDDVAALLRLTNFDLPPLRVVRPTQVVQVFYGFGDASGKQFGAEPPCRKTIIAVGDCPGRATVPIGYASELVYGRQRWRKKAPITRS